MLTNREIDDIAQSHIEAKYPQDCEILRREKHAAPDGIYFVANRRTDNPKDTYVGSGGFFILRSTGEIWEFGSGQIVYQGLEYWLQWYAEGWRPGIYRFRILNVTDPDRLADAIVQSGATYLFREIAHGAIWETRISYDIDLVQTRLKQLPCTFLLSVEEVRQILRVLDEFQIADVEYSHIGELPKQDWRPENNRPDQLGAQYE